VKDPLRAHAIERRAQRRAVADVDLEQDGGVVHLRAPTVGEVVDDRDLVAGLHECVDQVRADEAGPAGDERARAARNGDHRVVLR
jgi:hypothetical protein